MNKKKTTTKKKKKENCELCFAKRLKELLKDNNITSYRLANDAGIHEVGLQSILKGKVYPSFGTLVKIYRHFPEVSLYWLVLGEGPKNNLDGK